MKTPNQRPKMADVRTFALVLGLFLVAGVGAAVLWSGTGAPADSDPSAPPSPSIERGHRATGKSGPLQSAPLATDRYERSDEGPSVLADGSVFVASGIVVSREGKRLSGVMLVVERKADEDSVGWTPVPWLNAGLRSAPDGRFLVRGPAGLPWDARLRVRIRRRTEVPSPPVAFSPGTSGLRVVMSPTTGRLVGRVLLPAGTKDRARATLRPRDLHASPGQGFTTLVSRADWSLLFENLPPGDYDLDVEGVTVRGLTVRAGETSRDRKINPLDVRPAMDFVDFEIVDSHGLPVVGAMIWLVTPNGKQGCPTNALGRSRRSFRKSFSDVSFEIAKDGFRSVRLAEWQQDVRVTLEHAPSVMIRTSPGVRHLLDDLTLAVSLVPESGVHGGDFGQRLIHADRDTRLIVQNPGRYRLQWWIAQGKGPFSSKRRPLTTSALDVIDIHAKDRDSLVVARLTTEDVARARRR